MCIKDKPLLITYPRSGTHFVCYILEFLTKKTTGIGKKVLFPAGTGDDNPVIEVTHKGFRGIDDYTKVILVIRNYKECLIRNLKKFWDKREKDPERVKSFIEGVRNNQAPICLIRNIEAFEKYKGDKLLLYYEDLVSDTAREIQRLVDFLDLPKDHLGELLNNIDQHTRNSVKIYDKILTSATKGSAEKLIFHSRDLSLAEKKGFDEYFETRFPLIYCKYLRRYKER